MSVNTCTISWITDYLTDWTQCVRLGRAVADLVMCKVMLIFHQSAVVSTAYFTVVCWGISTGADQEGVIMFNFILISSSSNYSHDEGWCDE